jgi:hypothetical protein
MSCEIIQFSTAARVSPKRGKAIVRAAGTSRISRVELEQEPERSARDDVELSTTCKNGHIRQERREVWRMADAATRYWKVRREFHSAVSWAQRMGVPEAHSHPPDPDDRDRISMVKRWRTALVEQLLTPAPDGRSVKWKQAALASGEHCHIGVKSERIERAIADDLAFLAAHPVRQSRRTNSEAMARNREFKETMRQRIKDVAASRDLSDEDIKGAMTCKHHEIAKFTREHGVNVEWLLEGKGRIFKKDPIALNPNMTGSEFAAVVTTLPMADQQMITTMVREILQERDQ